MDNQIKKTVRLNGHTTSLALEKEFWKELNIIASNQSLSLNELVEKIKGGRKEHKIFFDVSKGTAEFSRTTYAGNTMILSIISSFVCEETAESVGEENISSGTAFFINNRGNLLTNNHVVDGCKELKINY